VWAIDDVFVFGQVTSYRRDVAEILSDHVISNTNYLLLEDKWWISVIKSGTVTALQEM